MVVHAKTRGGPASPLYTRLNLACARAGDGEKIDVDMANGSVARGAWTVEEIPLSWGIYEGTVLIAHTSVHLGKEETRVIARSIVTASDRQAELDAAVQNGTAQLSIKKN